MYRVSIDLEEHNSTDHLDFATKEEAIAFAQGIQYANPSGMSLNFSPNRKPVSFTDYNEED